MAINTQMNINNSLLFAAVLLLTAESTVIEWGEIVRESFTILGLSVAIAAGLRDIWETFR